jgi:ABC-type phosphate/phosphonate transport system ATPase subunit
MADEVMSDFKRVNQDMNISILLNIHHVDLALKYARESSVSVQVNLYMMVR